MTDQTTALALLRDAENYLSALHGSVARHDHLGVNLTCAGCSLRAGIAGALPRLAAVESAATELSETERTMLNYALDQAQERIWSDDGFTDEDQAAVDSLRRLTAEQPAAAERQDGAQR